MKLALRRGDTTHTAEITSDGGRLTIVLDGKPVAVDILNGDQGLRSLLIDGRAHTCDFDTHKGLTRVYIDQSVFEVEVLDERKARRQLVAGGLAASGPQVITAPMPGKVVKILVKVGQAVKAGDGVIIIEAMKMENELRASNAGTVQEIAAQEGVAVEGGAKLCVIG